MMKDVLFQKLANKWYLFVEIDGEIYSTILPRGVDPRSATFDINQIVASLVAEENVQVAG